MTRCTRSISIRDFVRKTEHRTPKATPVTLPRYGNANFMRSDFVLGIGNRWANRHTGNTLGIYTKDRKFVHVDVDPMQIGKVFCPDLGIVADAHSAFPYDYKKEELLKRLHDND